MEPALAQLDRLQADGLLIGMLAKLVRISRS
jgi:hypothetical protein